MQKAVLAHSADKDWAVRRQLAATLGVAEGGCTRERLSSACSRATATIRSWSTPRSAAWQEANRRFSTASWRRSSESPQRTAATMVLAATIVRGKQEAPSQRVLESDRRSHASRVAAGIDDDGRGVGRAVDAASRQRSWPERRGGRCRLSDVSGGSQWSRRRVSVSVDGRSRRCGRGGRSGRRSWTRRCDHRS